jgi:hypothetical protein
MLGASFEKCAHAAVTAQTALPTLFKAPKYSATIGDALMMGIMGHAYAPPIEGHVASRLCRRSNGLAHAAAFFVFPYLFLVFKYFKDYCKFKKFKFTKS